MIKKLKDILSDMPAPLKGMLLLVLPFFIPFLIVCWPIGKLYEYLVKE